MRPHVQPPAVAAAIATVARDQGADPDARADAVALLVGDAERMGTVGPAFEAVRAAASGAAERTLDGVKPTVRNPGETEPMEAPKPKRERARKYVAPPQEWAPWVPPKLSHVPELRLVRVSAGRPSRKSISGPKDMIAHMAFLAFIPYEEFWVALLDSKHRMLGKAMLSRGSVASSPVFVSEVLRIALHAGVPRIVVAHNHPTGIIGPSPDDVSITKRIGDACAILGDTKLLDSLIVGLGTEQQLTATLGSFPAARATYAQVSELPPEAMDEIRKQDPSMRNVSEDQSVYMFSMASAGLLPGAFG